MPQFDFYIDQREELALADAILASPAILVPDLEYRKRKYDEVSTIDVFASVRKRIKHFFVLYRELQESPLRMDKVRRGLKAIYYVEPGEGGPTLEVFWPTRFVEHGTEYISAGFLSCPSQYRSSNTRKCTTIPAALRSQYRALVQLIQANGREIRTDERTYWVSKAMEEEIVTGKLVLGHDRIVEQRLPEVL